MLIIFQMMIEINIRHTPPGTEFEKIKINHTSSQRVKWVKFLKSFLITM